jgi:hypothetical protein
MTDIMRPRLPSPATKQRARVGLLSDGGPHQVFPSDEGFAYAGPEATPQYVHQIKVYKGLKKLNTAAWGTPCHDKRWSRKKSPSQSPDRKLICSMYAKQSRYVHCGKEVLCCCKCWTRRGLSRKNGGWELNPSALANS